MKFITKKGLTTYFLGIEVAGIIAWIGTAIIMFLFMFVATQGDLFASVFFPIWMLFLLVVALIIQFINELFRSHKVP